VHGARCVREQAERLRGTDVVYEYSPESFTATELDFALEICEAVMDVWEPTPERKVLLNLPATVELATPNVYADQIEWFAGRVSRRDALVLSVHPHNDRGTAVAAAELALLAGAERVEGTLFGNGERTGNVDLCTLALNLLTQGVDPQLDLSDIERVVRTAEHCNRLPVHPRHPYAGELVFTAFSGSHQDAIRKALTARRVGGAEVWDVPYLPIDPADLGRSYTPVIRVNSQSGKAGVAYLLERDQGLALPRVLQIEFARRVQAIADASGEELGSEALWRMVRGEYVDLPGPVRLVDYRVVRDAGQGCDLAARLEIAGAPHRLHGCGSGPIAAFLDGLRGLGVEARVADYAEHALGAGNDAAAVCYVQLEGLGDEPLHGVGIDPDITTASLRALISAVNRAHRCGAWSVPAPRLAAGGIVSAFAAVPEEERCV
jgi:2-isopropylmalate synthase